MGAARRVPAHNRCCCHTHPLHARYFVLQYATATELNGSSVSHMYPPPSVMGGWGSTPGYSHLPLSAVCASKTFPSGCRWASSCLPQLAMHLSHTRGGENTDRAHLPPAPARTSMSHRSCSNPSLTRHTHQSYHASRKRSLRLSCRATPPPHISSRRGGEKGCTLSQSGDPELK